MIDLALQPSIAKLQSSNNHQSWALLLRSYKNQKVWLEHLQLIVDLFISTAKEKETKEQANQEMLKGKKKENKDLPEIPEDHKESDEDDDEELVPLNMARSVSQPIKKKSESQSHSLQNQQISAQSTQNLTLQIIKSMVQLLYAGEQGSSLISMNHSSPQKSSRQQLNGSMSHFTEAESQTKYLSQMWSLVLKSLTSTSINLLTEAKIFDSLISAFLVSSEEIKQITFPQILQITQTIVENSQRDKAKFISNLLFLTLENVTSSHHEKVGYLVCQGWLDIMIASNISRNSQYEIAKQVYAKFSCEEMNTFLKKTSLYLINHLNKGSFEGVAGAIPEIIMRLSLAQDLIYVVVNSESSEHSGQKAVASYFKALDHNPKYQKDFNDSINNLIGWLFLNARQAKDDIPISQLGNSNSLTPATQRVKQITESIEELFQVLGDNGGEAQEAIKIALKSLTRITSRTNTSVVELAESHSIGFELSTKLGERVNEYFIKLLSQWLINDKVASYFVFELKGFEFLLETIGLDGSAAEDQLDGNLQRLIKQKNKVEYSLQLNGQEDSNDSHSNGGINPKQDTETTGSDLIAYLEASMGEGQGAAGGQANQLQGTQEESSSSSNQVVSIYENQKQLYVQEFSKSISMVDNNGQDATANFQKTDWSVNKRAYKHRVIVKQLNGNLKSEYWVLFSLPNEVELREIQIGFNNFWAADNEIYAEPLSVLVEAGSDEKNLSLVCNLHIVKEDAFGSVSATVYGANLLSFSGQQEKIALDGENIQAEVQEIIQQKLQSIQNFRIKYIKFSMRRTILSCLENSPLASKFQKQLTMSINFISLLGYDITKVGNYQRHLKQEQKKTALEVLSLLCSGEFKSILKVISQQPQTILKLKQSFSMLASLVGAKENLIIEPTFIAISTYNDEMGDWIINQFLQLSSNMSMSSGEDQSALQKYASLIGCIVRCNKTEMPRRLKIFQDHVMGALRKIVKENRSSHTTLIKKIIPYVQVFIESLRIAAPDLGASNKIDLQVKEGYLVDILSLLSNSTAERELQTKVLVQLIVLLLIPPQPFVNSLVDAHSFTLNHLLDNSSSAFALDSQDALTQRETLVSILSVSKAKIASDVYERGLILERILLPESLQEKEGASAKLNHALKFWLNVSQESKIKEKLANDKLPLKLYSNLRQKNPEQFNKIIRKDNVVTEAELSLMIDLIKQLTSGSPTLESQLAEELMSDLDYLSKIRDMDFVNKVFLPLLRIEKTVPICFWPYDSDNEKWLPNYKPISASDNASNKSNQAASLANLHNTFVPSQLLQGEKRSTFIKNFKELMGQHSKTNVKKYLNSNWTLAHSQTENQSSVSQFSSFWKSIENKSPVVILISGTTQGGQSITYGCFSAKGIPAMPANLAQDSDYPVNSSPEDFCFCYIDENSFHHYAPKPGVPIISMFTDYEGGGAISVANDFMLMSYSYDFVFTVGVVYDLEKILVELNPKPAKEIESTITFQKFEIWTTDINKQPQQPQPVPTQVTSKSQLQRGLIGQDYSGDFQLPYSDLKHPWFNSTQPFNNYRSNPVFMVPAHLTLAQLSKIMLNSNVNFKSRGGVKLQSQHQLMNSHETIGEIYEAMLDNPAAYEQQNGIIDLEYEVNQLLSTNGSAEKKDEEKQSSSDISEGEKGDAHSSHQVQGYAPKMGIFEQFEIKGGVKLIISVTLQSMKLWKSEEQARSWELWLKELESFSEIPLFFQLFLKNSKCKDLLFKVLAGLPDTEVNANIKPDASALQKWEDEQKQAVQFNYKILQEVFQISNDLKLREIGIKSGLLPTILERLGAISGEKSRTFEEIEEVKAQEESKEPEASAIQQMSQEKNVDKKKRKGVGYSTKVGQTFNVNQYLENKKLRNDQIKILIDILINFFKSKEWQAGEEVSEIILESPLLPLLESAFRNGSWLDMAKEYEVYHSYLALARSISSQKSLVKCLADIDPRYKPSQTEPIFKLLNRLNDLAQIFINCLNWQQKIEQQPLAKPQVVQDAPAQPILNPLISQTTSSLFIQPSFPQSPQQPSSVFAQQIPTTTPQVIQQQPAQTVNSNAQGNVSGSILPPKPPAIFNQFNVQDVSKIEDKPKQNTSTSSPQTQDNPMKIAPANINAEPKIEVKEEFGAQQIKQLAQSLSDKQTLNNKLDSKLLESTPSASLIDSKAITQGTSNLKASESSLAAPSSSSLIQNTKNEEVAKSELNKQKEIEEAEQKAYEQLVNLTKTLIELNDKAQALLIELSNILKINQDTQLSDSNAEKFKNLVAEFLSCNKEIKKNIELLKQVKCSQLKVPFPTAFSWVEKHQSLHSKYLWLKNHFCWKSIQKPQFASSQAQQVPPLPPSSLSFTQTSILSTSENKKPEVLKFGEGLTFKSQFPSSSVAEKMNSELLPKNVQNHLKSMRKSLSSISTQISCLVAGCSFDDFKKDQPFWVCEVISSLSFQFKQIIEKQFMLIIDEMSKDVNGGVSFKDIPQQTIYSEWQKWCAAKNIAAPPSIESLKNIVASKESMSDSKSQENQLQKSIEQKPSSIQSSTPTSGLFTQKALSNPFLLNTKVENLQAKAQINQTNPVPEIKGIQNDEKTGHQIIEQNLQKQNPFSFIPKESNQIPKNPFLQSIQSKEIQDQSIKDSTDNQADKPISPKISQSALNQFTGNSGLPKSSFLSFNISDSSKAPTKPTGNLFTLNPSNPSNPIKQNQQPTQGNPLFYKPQFAQAPLFSSNIDKVESFPFSGQAQKITALNNPFYSKPEPIQNSFSISNEMMQPHQAEETKNYKQLENKNNQVLFQGQEAKEESSFFTESEWSYCTSDELDVQGIKSEWDSKYFDDEASLIEKGSFSSDSLKNEKRTRLKKLKYKYRILKSLRVIRQCRKQIKALAKSKSKAKVSKKDKIAITEAQQRIAESRENITRQRKLIAKLDKWLDGIDTDSDWSGISDLKKSKPFFDKKKAKIDFSSLKQMFSDAKFSSVKITPKIDNETDKWREIKKIYEDQISYYKKELEEKNLLLNQSKEKLLSNSTNMDPKQQQQSLVKIQDKVQNPFLNQNSGYGFVPFNKNIQSLQYAQINETFTAGHTLQIYQPYLGYQQPTKFINSQLTTTAQPNNQTQLKQQLQKSNPLVPLGLMGQAYQNYVTSQQQDNLKQQSTIQIQTSSVLVNQGGYQQLQQIQQKSDSECAPFYQEYDLYQELVKFVKTSDYQVKFSLCGNDSSKQLMMKPAYDVNIIVNKYHNTYKLKAYNAESASEKKKEICILSENFSKQSKALFSDAKAKNSISDDYFDEFLNFIFAEILQTSQLQFKLRELFYQYTQISNKEALSSMIGEEFKDFITKKEKLIEEIKQKEHFKFKIINDKLPKQNQEVLKTVLSPKKKNEEVLLMPKLINKGQKLDFPVQSLNLLVSQTSEGQIQDSKEELKNQDAKLLIDTLEEPNPEQKLSGVKNQKEVELQKQKEDFNGLKTSLILELASFMADFKLKSKQKEEAVAKAKLKLKTDSEIPEKLAKDVIKTSRVVQAAVSKLLKPEGDDNFVENALNKPLPECYRALLQDLRFDNMDMKDPNDQSRTSYKHHYNTISQQNSNPPSSKMVRLAQELADLSNALPSDHTNAIFVRVDQTRVDMMKALVCGASKTPYAHGCYEFDIFCDNNYPKEPPKMNLITTGNGSVRFNPNLYACGKVCLSLLGTWRGSATENWDPKLSTILQVLLSTQAIIMSEEVYFNEPGFENEAGTPEGEKKNEGYQNIVRYCNIKFAMVEQLKKPSKGFESVIKRHFYIKKQEILKEVNEWVALAESNEATYMGLVNDHNYTWANQFKASKTKYKEMLVAVIQQLEDELNKLERPTDYELKLQQNQNKRLNQAALNQKKKQGILEGKEDLDKINVDYEDEKSQEEQIDTSSKEQAINVEDEKVKDRWSRYIGAMGVEAVAKQANANIFLSGAGALGIEIAKNLVLSGCRSFTLHDCKPISRRDLSGQFFINYEEDVENESKRKATRGEACMPRLKQLNHYVKCQLAPPISIPLNEEDLEKAPWNLHLMDVVIVTEATEEEIVYIDEYCRKRGKKFISADAYGVFTRVFNDFGENFEVLDPNGEELQDVMIKSITNEEQAIVELLPGQKHKLQDGDEVLITGVEGMELLHQDQMIQEGQNKSINESVWKVKVMTPHAFKIEDTRGYSPYIRNGIAKQLKTKRVMQFKSYQESMLAADASIPQDENLQYADFEKIQNNQVAHVAFEALSQFRKSHQGQLPEPWNKKDAEEFVALALKVAEKNQDLKSSEWKIESSPEIKLLYLFSFTCSGVFNPLCAFMGGFVAQECVKAITQKFSPTHQVFYYDALEVLPEFDPKIHLQGPQEEEQKVENYFEDVYVKQIAKTTEKDHRSDGLRIILGEDLVEKLAHTRLFMVGAGAIGCELLKNYAMLGVGTGKGNKQSKLQPGTIVLTDPDVIEVSNLNRQFLFREKHLRNPKSSTAAAAAIYMNKELKQNIVARLDKVHEGTAHIYTDQFFEGLTVVTNALDNVHARRYIDSRCVVAKTPLLESGTLGPKGHVQVVLPFLTESYGSQTDPDDAGGEIPHCTLKMFPEETLHCVEWARDKFGKIFTQKIQNSLKVLEEGKSFNPVSQQDIISLKECIKILDKRPKNYEDCVAYARHKFEKYYNHDIKQLLHVYPLDAKTKDGNLFWSLPKRPPVPMNFEHHNPLHNLFVTAFANLRANTFKIPIPSEQPRSEAWRQITGAKAQEIKVEEFVPNDEKAKEIQASVSKDQKEEDKKEEDKEAQEDKVDPNDLQALMKRYTEQIESLPIKEGKIDVEAILKAENFEKDEDANHHIDVIYAMANCRSTNYKLDPMDWLTVKLKAGRIVPALSTTTSCVAGLQTLELVKLLKGCKKADHRNIFMNMAVPFMQASEPGDVAKTKLTEDIEVDLWSRWDVKLGKDVTLKQVIENVEQEHPGLEVRDVLRGNAPLYFHALMTAPGKEKDREALLNTKVMDLVGAEEGEDKYVDIAVTCVRKKVLKQSQGGEAQEEGKEQKEEAEQQIDTSSALNDNQLDNEGHSSDDKSEHQILSGVPPVRVHFE